MPRRTLLSSEQRTRLFGIPTEAAEVAKHYVLSAEDLALVRAKRRPNNRLGYAVQLCVLRHPGRPLEASEVPPAAMLAFVANQVGADPKLFGDYAHRAETRREHLLELQPRLRLRSFRLADWRACLHVGTNAAGKPKGARHRTTLAAEALLDGDAETLTRKAIELALGGDTIALRLCLDRILPPRRERPMSFELPRLLSAADATAAMAAITAAVAAGEILLGEAAELAKLVETFVKAIEANEFEQRLRALEARDNAIRP